MHTIKSYFYNDNQTLFAVNIRRECYLGSEGKLSCNFCPAQCEKRLPACVQVIRSQCADAEVLQRPARVKRRALILCAFLFLYKVDHLSPNSMCCIHLYRSIQFWHAINNKHYYSCLTWNCFKHISRAEHLILFAWNSTNIYLIFGKQ